MATCTLFRYIKKLLEIYRDKNHLVDVLMEMGAHEFSLSKLELMLAKDNAVPITINEMYAINLLLEKHNLGSLNIFEDSNMMPSDLFNNEAEIEVYLSSFYSKEVGAQVSLRWHIRSYLELKKIDGHLLKMKTVILAKANEQKDINAISKSDWLKSLDNKKQTTRITIGHSFINMATEAILSKIFSVPFLPPIMTINRHGSFGIRHSFAANSIPFSMHVDKDELRGRINPPFYLPYEELGKYSVNDHGLNTTSVNAISYSTRRCFRLGSELFIASRREELKKTSDTLVGFGVLILRRFPTTRVNGIGTRLLGSIIGTSAPLNLAVAKYIASNKYSLSTALPPLDKDNDIVLVICIKAEYSVRDSIKSSGKEDMDPVHANTEEWRQLDSITPVYEKLWHHKDREKWVELEK